MKLNLLCKIRTVCLHSLPIDAVIDTGYNDINNIGVVTNEAVPERNQYDGTRSEGILQGSSDGTPQSGQRLAVGAESGEYLPANRVLVAEHLNQRPSVYNDSTRSIAEQASAETKKGPHRCSLHWREQPAWAVIECVLDASIIIRYGPRQFSFPEGAATHFFGLSFALYAFTAASFMSQPNFCKNSNRSSSVTHCTMM